MTEVAARPRGEAAFHYGPGHLIMHGNPPFLAAFGESALGLPAREAMVGLPSEAFDLMDRVLRSGRSLATTIDTPGGRRRLIVVPRREPEIDEPYGVTTYLRREA
jgi:hypothetical protein